MTAQIRQNRKVIPAASSGGTVSITVYLTTGASIATGTSYDVPIDEVYYPAGQTTFDWLSGTYPHLIQINDVGVYWVSAWVQGTTTDSASAVQLAIEDNGTPFGFIDIRPLPTSFTGGANITWQGTLVAPVVVSGSAHTVGITVQNYSTTASISFDDASLSIVQMAPSGYTFET